MQTSSGGGARTKSRALTHQPARVERTWPRGDPRVLSGRATDLRVSATTEPARRYCYGGTEKTGGYWLAARGSRLRSIAQVATCARAPNPNLLKMLLTCVSMVRSLNTSASA